MRQVAYLAGLMAALFVLVVGLTFYASRAEKPTAAPGRQAFSLMTTLPVETASVLADAYEAYAGIQVEIISLSPEEVLERLKGQAASKDGAALLLADSSTLQKAAAEGYLVPYVSETNDMVRDSFRQSDGYWTGVWYDPVVFAVNRDYLKTLRSVPDTWQELSRTKARIGVTDFMAAEASANLLYSQMAQFGDAATLAIWRGIHPNVVQYARYLSNPVRQAGMGEVDIAVAVESEALRYIHDGYPIKLVYPADGTSSLLTGTGIALGASERDTAAAQAFADWLLTDDAQMALQSHSFFFLTTNPDTMAYKSFAGKNIVLFSQGVYFTKEQKKSLLDRWVREVRFAS